jgi:enoyl-CoA hydratase/carnithine racemase
MPTKCGLVMNRHPGWRCDHAREIGLAWRVHAHDDLLAEAHGLADRLCQGSPLAIRATNEMAHRGRKMPWSDSVRMGETMRPVITATEDAKEGRAAWSEKREPEWKGR